MTHTKTHVICLPEVTTGVTKKQIKLISNKSQFNPIHSLVFSLEGRAWQEPEPSHVTGMALAHCILGKFLGVVCRCFPPPLDVPTLAATCLRPLTQYHYKYEYKPLSFCEGHNTALLHNISLYLVQCNYRSYGAKL